MLNFICILMSESRGFPDGLDEECEEKRAVKDDSTCLIQIVEIMWLPPNKME